MSELTVSYIEKFMAKEDLDRARVNFETAKNNYKYHIKNFLALEGDKHINEVKAEEVAKFLKDNTNT